MDMYLSNIYLAVEDFSCHIKICSQKHLLTHKLVNMRDHKCLFNHEKDVCEEFCVLFASML
jgi:hypothetical protein